MPSLCQSLKISHENLQRLWIDFVRLYKRRDAHDLQELRALRKKSEGAKEVLLSYFMSFDVPNAKNPFREALLASGLKKFKVRERQATRLDLLKEIKRQVSVYQEVKNEEGDSLLEEWVKDIEENGHLIYTQVARDRAKIVERIKEGMIPIVMPSREVQERTWEIALLHLRPIWMGSDGELTVREGAFIDAYTTDSTNKMTKEGFFKNIPDRPYLVWAKPTQRPDQETTKKSFEEQRDFYAKMIQNDAQQLYDPTDIIPTELAALQAIFTRQIGDIYNIYGELTRGKELKLIRPLDSSLESTTRFLSAGRFYEGAVPTMRFNIDSRALFIGEEEDFPEEDSGFRPAARS